jgi:uncharacterized protein (DUF58 family)
MHKASPQVLCQIYISLVLLAAALMSPLPYLVLSLVLLLIIMYILVRPQPPRLNMVIDLAVMFLASLVIASVLDNITNLASIAAHIIAVVFVLPMLYLLDFNLRENVRHTQAFTSRKGERNTTRIFASLLIATLVIMLIAPVVNRPVLLFTGISLALYLMVVLLEILFTIPRRPFVTDTMLRRIIVDTTGSTRLILTSQTWVKMHGRLSFTVPWAQVNPQNIIFSGGKVNLEISFTPPLAGESRPQLQISAVDPRGLIQINQLLEPVDLHIIPKAEYAEWLAMKYLEQTGSGIISSVNLPSQAFKPKRGIEYLESRAYQPGDPLRDIDWKHTLKLSQIIVREYQEANDRATIIAVNLSVTDAEAADNLAFNLMTVALTLAREKISALLVAYDHESVIHNTGIIEPMEMLRETLSLLREIKVVEFADRYLDPSDIAKIRRNIRQLRQADSEPAQRLLDILNFEHRSIEQEARTNPATLALVSATKQVSAPAIILLVSQLNHDVEAVLVTAEKLAKMRFNTLPIEMV